MDVTIGIRLRFQRDFKSIRFCNRWDFLYHSNWDYPKGCERTVDKDGYGGWTWSFDGWALTYDDYGREGAMG